MGMVMLVKLVHFVKALLGMLFIPFPIVTLVKLSHSQNAQLPIEVTESGIEMLVKLLHLVKAYQPMDVTESGIARLVTSSPFRYNAKEHIGYDPDIVVLLPRDILHQAAKSKI